MLTTKGIVKYKLETVSILQIWKITTEILNDVNTCLYVNYSFFICIIHCLRISVLLVSIKFHKVMF